MSTRRSFASESAAGLNCIGVALDTEANNSDAPVISAKNSSVTVRVIRTNEDLMIARHTWQRNHKQKRDTEKQ